MEPMCRSGNNFQKSLLSLTMLILHSNSGHQVERVKTLYLLSHLNGSQKARLVESRPFALAESLEVGSLNLYFTKKEPESLKSWRLVVSMVRRVTLCPFISLATLLKQASSGELPSV